MAEFTLQVRPDADDGEQLPGPHFQQHEMVSLCSDRVGDAGPGVVGEPPGSLRESPRIRVARASTVVGRSPDSWQAFG